MYLHGNDATTLGSVRGLKLDIGFVFYIRYHVKIGALGNIGIDIGNVQTQHFIDRVFQQFGIIPVEQQELAGVDIRPAYPYAHSVHGKLSLAEIMMNFLQAQGPFLNSSFQLGIQFLEAIFSADLLRHINACADQQGLVGEFNQSAGKEIRCGNATLRNDMGSRRRMTFNKDLANLVRYF